MFVVLFFLALRTGLSLTPPTLEIIITVCHEKGKLLLPLTVTYFLNDPSACYYKFHALTILAHPHFPLPKHSLYFLTVRGRSKENLSIPKVT